MCTHAAGSGERTTLARATQRLPTRLPERLPAQARPLTCHLSPHPACAAPAGVSATSADIVFLGSGKYEFAPVPPKYVRPVYMPAPSTPTPPTEAASTSGSNGMMIGIILGSVAAAAIALALAATFCVRRRRQQKLNGQGLVHKWESERKQGELPATGRRVHAYCHVCHLPFTSQRAATLHVVVACPICPQHMAALALPLTTACLPACRPPCSRGGAQAAAGGAACGQPGSQRPLLGTAAEPAGAQPEAGAAAVQAGHGTQGPPGCGGGKDGGGRGSRGSQ